MATEPITDRVATLKCERGRKREDCLCEPCKARRQIYGGNVRVQEQEARRAALAKGLIPNLTHEAPKDVPT